MSYNIIFIEPRLIHSSNGTDKMVRTKW